MISTTLRFFQNMRAVSPYHIISLTTCLMASLMAVMRSTMSFAFSPIDLRASPKITDQMIRPKVLSPSISSPTRRTSMRFCKKDETPGERNGLRATSCINNYHCKLWQKEKCLLFAGQFLHRLPQFPTPPSESCTEDEKIITSWIFHSFLHRMYIPYLSNNTYLGKASLNRICWRHVPIKSKETHTSTFMKLIRQHISQLGNVDRSEKKSKERLSSHLIRSNKESIVEKASSSSSSANARSFQPTPGLTRITNINPTTHNPEVNTGGKNVYSITVPYGLNTTLYNSYKFDNLHSPVTAAQHHEWRINNCLLDKM